LLLPLPLPRICSIFLFPLSAIGLLLSASSHPLSRPVGHPNPSIRLLNLNSYFSVLNFQKTPGDGLRLLTSHSSFPNSFLFLSHLHSQTTNILLSQLPHPGRHFPFRHTSLSSLPGIPFLRRFRAIGIQESCAVQRESFGLCWVPFISRGLLHCLALHNTPQILLLPLVLSHSSPTQRAPISYCHLLLSSLSPYICPFAATTYFEDK
jgi:hypothetical protein